MTIEDFWNQAFLASLTRLSPECAKISADQALEICLRHWDSCSQKRAAGTWPKWQDQNVGNAFIPEKPNYTYPGFTAEVDTPSAPTN